MGKTAIQWTDFTFNGWVGCQRVSPGCEHCYAEAYDKRVGGLPKAQRKDPNVQELRWGPKAPRVRTSDANWRKPFQWDNAALQANVAADIAGRPRPARPRVFCSSLADVFEDRPELEEWRNALFGVIASTPHLDWQLLTKRPENLAKMNFRNVLGAPWDWPANVWLGTTAENQEWLIKRLKPLLEGSADAPVRFISYEPALGRIDPYFFEMAALDWVIVGGESGPGARPFNLDWARSIVDWGKQTNTAVFVKQIGENPYDESTGWLDRIEYKDRHGGDPAEWPVELRVRQFPEVRR